MSRPLWRADSGALAGGSAARASAALGPLHWLGEISYSTYLSHFLLFVLFKLVFVDQSMQIGWGKLGLFLLMVLTASVALYYLVERPAQQWLLRRSIHRVTA
jgi:peptidoglycan/LPS O-acetylase OafA/YrhL